MTHTPTAMDSVKSTQNVEPSKVFEFQANLAFENIVENFRFTKAEDIMFPLELSNDSVFKLFWKGTNEKT